MEYSSTTEKVQLLNAVFPYWHNINLKWVRNIFIKEYSAQVSYLSNLFNLCIMEKCGKHFQDIKEKLLNICGVCILECKTELLLSIAVSIT